MLNDDINVSKIQYIENMFRYLLDDPRSFDKICHNLKLVIVIFC